MHTHFYDIEEKDFKVYNYMAYDGSAAGSGANNN